MEQCASKKTMPIVKEINFDGYRFRSKIEAKWYVFFKTLGLDVHYEPETISLELLDGKLTNYLVDYYLPDLDAYIEIKLDKNPTVEESMKCFLLSQQTGKDVFLFYETIGKKNTNGYKYCGDSGAFVPQQMWTQCPKCSTFGITYRGFVAELSCGCCREMGDLTNSESFAIQEAVKAVRGERFGA